MRRNYVFAVLLWVLSLVPAALAQDDDSPSIGIFAGAGLDSSTVNRGALQVGASVDQYFPNHWIGYIFEGGFISPFADLHAGSAIFSINYLTSWKSRRAAKWFPFATVGYSQLFGTGNAINFGGGLDLRLTPKIALRFEGRDYFSFSPHQHNAAIRIGLRRYFYD